uniref:Uncharacterized protein n=1 Tax=Anguilla anguilla TaxID=7936 RepID=A0A0E9TVP9_ANGAN
MEALEFSEISLDSRSGPWSLLLFRVTKVTYHLVEP